MKTLFLFLVSIAAFGQTPANFLAGGGSYSLTSDPGGWLAYATLISAKGPVYSFSEVTITNATKGKFSPQTAVTTGLATTLRTIGKLSIYGLANAGMATNSAATGSAFAGGGVALWKINDQWSIVLGGQFLKTTAQTQAVMSFGLGRSW